MVCSASGRCHGRLSPRGGVLTARVKRGCRLVTRTDICPVEWSQRFTAGCRGGHRARDSSEALAQPPNDAVNLRQGDALLPSTWAWRALYPFCDELLLTVISELGRPLAGASIDLHRRQQIA